MSDHSTLEEKNAFQAAIDSHAGLRTAAEQAAAPGRIADLDAMARAAINPSDPRNAYYGRPDLAAMAIAKLDALYTMRGVAKPVAAIAAPAAPMPASLNEGQRELLANAEAMMAANPNRDNLAAELRTRMGPTNHAALVLAAEQTLGAKASPELLASEASLRLLANVTFYNRKIS